MKRLSIISTGLAWMLVEASVAVAHPGHGFNDASHQVFEPENRFWILGMLAAAVVCGKLLVMLARRQRPGSRTVF